MDLSAPQSLAIRIVADPRPDVTIVKLIGPVTVHNFSKFQELLQSQPPPRFLFIDVSEVPYIDSAALGSFVSIHVSCEGTDRKYALVGANERLKNLFDIAYVRSFLAIYDSMAEAEEQTAPK